MPHLITLALVPVIATALMLVSQRRGWSPPLWAALVIGLVLRLGMLAAQRGGPFPWDFAVDFHDTAVNVLSLHDPVLNIREGGWHFLSLMAYVLAGQLWFARVTGLSWNTAGHLVPIVADLVLMLLVGRLARGREALRRFQWACNPLAIMVCGLHGQIEPMALAFGVGAFVVARSQVRNRAVFAGILAGLSITTNSWPVLLLPGILLTLSGTRRRLTMLAWSFAVPFVFLVTQPLFVRPFTYRYLPDIVKSLLHTRAIVGDWGWTSLLTGGAQLEVPLLGKIGTLVLAAGIIAALWWWRRAHPVDLTIVILLAFLIVTHRMGTQYLLWPLPFLFAHPSPSHLPNRAASRRSIFSTTRATPYLVLVSSAWAWAGYGPLTVLGTNPVNWRQMHVGWAWSSFAVIAVMVWALPWRRRIDTGPTPPDAPEPELAAPPPPAPPPEPAAPRA